MLNGPFPDISNLSTWREQVRLTDLDDGSLIDVTTDVDAITVRLRDLTGTTVLEDTLASGAVAVLGLGVIEFVFTAAQLADLCPSTYEVGLLVTFNAGAGGDVEQVILGTVPILKGL